jgi:hypothetical protein
MRTINKSKATKIKIDTLPIMKIPLDISDRHPCYWASNSKENGRLIWKVGIDSEDLSDEHAFEMDDVKENKSERFACSLLDIYQKCGKEAVEAWLKNGCP